MLGLDSLGYLSIEGLLESTSASRKGFCLACFDGEYPVIPVDEIRRQVLPGGIAQRASGKLCIEPEGQALSEILRKGVWQARAARGTARPATHAAGGSRRASNPCPRRSKTSWASRPASSRRWRLILASPGKVITTGIGKSGIVARKITATLSSTGTTSIFLHPVEALHGDLGMVQPRRRGTGAEPQRRRPTSWSAWCPSSGSTGPRWWP